MLAEPHLRSLALGGAFGASLPPGHPNAGARRGCRVGDPGASRRPQALSSI